MNKEEKPPSPWKPALYGFGFLLVSALLFLKPHLPKTFFYNFANIDDYAKFSNRIVSIDQPKSWLRHESSTLKLPIELDQLLQDLDTTALLVIKEGKIEFERYYLDATEQQISGSFSMAKSIVGLLVGIAIDEGLISSEELPISDFIPEWKNREEGKITLKQLLQMSSGLNWNEAYANPLSVTSEAYYGDNLFAPTLKQRLVEAPGVHFNYQSGSTQLLGLALTRITKKTLASYASEKLWKPLGAETEALWSLDHDGGMEKAFCCFNATARDFARLGQLVLDQGKWNGRQIVSEAWIEKMTTPHRLPTRAGSETDYYGYHWWIIQHPKGNAIHAQGILGQYVLVIPSARTVVVRLGQKRGKKIGHTYEEALKLVNWITENKID